MKKIVAQSTQRFDVIVVGGGAAGMMAAGRSAERGKRVLLLEKNKTLGAKLAISGGGRCNILNAEFDLHVLLKQYGPAAKFLFSPFTVFGAREAMDFFEQRGLPLIVEMGSRAFPATQRAEDVVATLEKYARDNRVVVRVGSGVAQVITEKSRVTQVVAGGERFVGETVVLATGGLSHQETGSTGDGFNWLRMLGHQVQPPTPTIVPLAVGERWVKNLAGTTLLNVKITFFNQGKKQFTKRGNVLCTHFGISGPLILNSAGRVADLLQAGVVTGQMDFFPELDLGTLEKQLIVLFDSHKNKDLKNTLKHFLPPGTAAELLALASVRDPNLKVHSVTRDERKYLAGLFKAVPFTVAGLMGFDRAVVADGGVPLTEIDPRTFRSRIIDNLFIVGDLLHINRPSGGYSLQLCWTSGYVAGNSI